MSLHTHTFFDQQWKGRADAELSFPLSHPLGTLLLSISYRGSSPPHFPQNPHCPDTAQALTKIIRTTDGENPPFSSGIYWAKECTILSPSWQPCLWAPSDWCQLWWKNRLPSLRKRGASFFFAALWVDQKDRFINGKASVISQRQYIDRLLLNRKKKYERWLQIMLIW